MALCTECYVCKMYKAGPAGLAVLVTYVTFCYSAMEHSANKFLPYFVVKGRQPCWTVDLALMEAKAQKLQMPEYVHQVVE